MKLRMGAVSGALALALLSWASAASSFAPQSQLDRERNFTYERGTGLVAAVREATAKYQDVAEAVHDGYTPVLGCVSSPDAGAMGVHYVKPELIGDGAEDVAHPELLVYEPLHNGGLRLVAVEYLTLAELWDGNHSDGSPPILMGQLFDYTNGPNRFRLPSHYSLHVWAWKYNRAGAFAMWNPRVSCTEYTEA